MTSDPFRIPEDADIADAERNLNFHFPPAYVEFLKGGSDVANAYFEPAVIFPGSSYLDIFQIAESAWTHSGVPKDWLPFIEDNGDHFCVSQTGEVSYWSHNGATNERWPNFSAWFQQVCVERN
ncbi:SMI1/KNR4 family protein [Pseudomonas sp. ZB1P45]|uniref:SMI1/KNR4 family protein n=1 Tax=Pseudomonas frigoris TaxID=3398356 RepID=UPI0039EFE26B